MRHLHEDHPPNLSDHEVSGTFSQGWANSWDGQHSEVQASWARPCHEMGWRWIQTPLSVLLGLRAFLQAVSRADGVTAVEGAQS